MMEPTNNEAQIDKSLQNELNNSHHTVTPTEALLVDVVKENYFDKHITAIFILANIFLIIIINTPLSVKLLTNFLPGTVILDQFLGILSFSFLIITVVLGASNFRDKKKEIFDAVGRLFIIGMIIFIVWVGVLYFNLIGI